MPGVVKVDDFDNRTEQGVLMHIGGMENADQRVLMHIGGMDSSSQHSHYSEVQNLDHIGDESISQVRS